MISVRNISKRLFLTTLTCPTLGWNNHNNATEPIRSIGEQFRIDEGSEIGERARLLFPGGLLIDEIKMSAAAERTQRALKDPSSTVIFEGAFLADGFAARADVLRRSKAGWDMMEVKSSVNDDGGFVDDMAYTTMVLSRCGLEISSVSLLLISRDYRLGMSDQDLFVEYDYTAEVSERVKEFEPYWHSVEQTMREPDQPEPRLDLCCKKCDLFRDCVGKDIDHHIFELPRLSQNKFDQLEASEIVRIEDIPDDFQLTDNQKIVRDTILKKRPTIRASLGPALAEVKWPAYYLDFETVKTAIPLYPDIPPHTQVPTQYSIHLCDDLDHVTDHFEYLADPLKDCREELAVRLIKDLAGEGSIIVYSSFELTTLKNLSKNFPHLAEQLKGLINRLVDLLAIIQKNFYHQDFQGSTSIKKVLPVLVPEMSYDEMQIADGQTAIAAFAKLAKGKHEEEEAKSIKQDLLEYCKQDTLAMVKLHPRLEEFSK